ncbi:MAG TPA: hypothetical protein VLA23_01610 [Candidatus Limnocylindrales bacterium]|nr:hypothetical protein [Candidatus Limnocylindrales bacterium]
MRRCLALVAAVGLLVAVASTSTVAAKSEGGHQIRASIEMGYPSVDCPEFPAEITPPADLQLGACWQGTITGGLNGAVAFWERPQIFLGPHGDRLERFFEVFLFRLDGGEWIYGSDSGVWNFSTFKYRAQGWVTAASAGMEHLVGWHYFYSGTTHDASDEGWPFWTDDTVVRMSKAKGG